MAIRVLTHQDAAAYQTIRLAALGERPPAFGSVPQDEPPLELLRARLPATRDRQFFGGFVDSQLVGIARLSRYSAENEKHRAYLAGLYVLPSHRNRGLGKSLVRAALDHAIAEGDIVRLNLTVVAKQLPAIRLYESFGFIVCGTDPEAFSCDGNFYDEHLMTLDLRAEAGSPNQTPQRTGDARGPR